MTKTETENQIQILRQELGRLNEDNEQIKTRMISAPADELWVYELLLEMNEVGTDDWPYQGLIGETSNIQSLQKQIKTLVWKQNSNRSIIKPGTITDEDIQIAKQIKIETLYQGKLKKTGNKLWGKCPFHTEKSGSFCIYLAQNSWWCYGCNQGGSIVDFLMKQQHMKFIEAIKFLRQK